MTDPAPTALVAGIGSEMGDVLCRQFAEAGYRVAGVSRRAGAGMALVESLGPHRFLAVQADLTDAGQVARSVTEVETQFGSPDVYIHNAARLYMQPYLDTAPGEFDSLWRTMCLGAVHGTQRVLPAMLARNSGTLLFIGATASVRAGAQFAAFGAAKFALRGLAQSLAREFGPLGIHVVHLIIDGVIWGDRARERFGMSRDQCLDPAAVAHTCLSLVEQERSAWTHELDIRPDGETF